MRSVALSLLLPFTSAAYAQAPMTLEDWGGSLAGPGPVEVPDAPPPIVPDTWFVHAIGADFAWIQHVVRRRGLPGTRGDGDFWELHVGTRLPAGVRCAVTYVESERDEVRMARLPGAPFLFVNGEGHVGDPDRRGDHGTPVHLREGTNELLVLTDSSTFGLQEGVELELWAPTSRTVVGTWDVVWSQPYGTVSFPVFNASTEPVEDLHVHYGHLAPEDAAAPRVHEWACGHRVAPLGLALASPPLDVWTCEWSGRTEGATIGVAPVVTFEDGDVRADRRLLRAPLPAVRSLRSTERPVVQGMAPLPKHLRLVVGTAGTPEEDALLLERARFDQHLAWYRQGVVPRLLTDEQLLEDPEESDEDMREPFGGPPIVLYGNAHTNRAWERLAPRDLPFVARCGEVRVRGQRFQGDGIGGWVVLRRNPVVLALVDTGPVGARLGYRLRTLDELQLGWTSAGYALYELDDAGYELREVASGPLR